MIKLRPYPEYKNSGVPSLGKIPAHWELFRNGRLFSQRNETGFGELPILEVSLKTGVRVRDMENLKRKQVMSDREKYKRAAQGDIAYNMMRMWQGAVGIAPVDGLVSPAYVVVRPFPLVDCRYFTYLFRTTLYMNEVDAYSRGIVKDRNRLYWQDFKRMPSVVPPVEEQRYIARFLDWNTAQINKFIRNKRRLIELLKVQKQNVINQAVTRGLNSNPKFKPSGVEWIGDIPEHWEVRRAKYILEEKDMRWGEKSGNLLMVSQYTGTTKRPVREETEELDTRSDSLVGYKVVQCNEMVINIMLAWNGSIGVSPEDGVVSPAYCVYSIQNGEPWYFHHLLRSNLYRAEIKRRSRGVIDSRLRLYSDDLFRIHLIEPPHNEQVEILKFIEKETDSIDQAITRAQHEIELIREYRNRLISDVVTGQIDVRGIEVPEVAEEELLVLDKDAIETDDGIDGEGDMEAEE